MKWDSAIADYQHYLRLERGLAAHSITNYARDVRKLIRHLQSHDLSTSPAEIDRKAVEAFIYDSSKSISPRSQARLISGLRSFFDYMIFEGYRKDNPMELIESPKLGRKLPDTLSVAEIDTLIQAIDLSSAEGERNRAVLETLYGCGLRVSELVELKCSDLFFEEQFIKVTGKGSKQRFVPVSPHTQRYINLYIREVRPHVQVQNVMRTMYFSIDAVNG